MASKIKAINAYCPRVELGDRVETPELVEFIARSTGLNESGVSQMLLELRDAVVFFNLRGRPVKLEGLGTYFPTVSLDGSIKSGHRSDAHIANGINAPGKFQGQIRNRDNIGKTSDELVARWNEEHPDDPVT
jgi:hypothetical protein